MGFIRSLDPKLVSTVIATALARAILAIGGDPVGDPLWNGLIALGVGAIVGWLWPNDGTVLRTKHERGNPRGPRRSAAERGESLIGGLATIALLLLVLILFVSFARML